MATFGTSTRTFGGLAIDRSVFREKLPDETWVLWAAGWVNAGDTNVATVSLAYQKDDASYVSLGTVTHNTATATKKTIGPIDLFANGSVPQKTETVVMVRLRAVKDTGADGEVENWTVWLELRPRRA